MPFQKGQSGNLAGKPKGTRAKATVAREAEIKASGITPLEFMLEVMRDPKATIEHRHDMAKAAAPYVHPKLASVSHTGDQSAPLYHVIEERIIDTRSDG